MMTTSPAFMMTAPVRGIGERSSHRPSRSDVRAPRRLGDPVQVSPLPGEDQVRTVPADRLDVRGLVPHDARGGPTVPPFPAIHARLAARADGQEAAVAREVGARGGLGEA